MAENLSYGEVDLTEEFNEFWNTVQLALDDAPEEALPCEPLDRLYRLSTASACLGPVLNRAGLAMAFATEVGHILSSDEDEEGPLKYLRSRLIHFVLAVTAKTLPILLTDIRMGEQMAAKAVKGEYDA